MDGVFYENPKDPLLAAVACSVDRQHLYGRYARAAAQAGAEDRAAHVIANSDEAADQAQKLRVRDGVLACVSGLTADCETADDARKCIAAHLPEIAEAAQRVLAGSGYDVTVSLGPETYGTRDYASFSLPAGTYPSLRVQIGEAAGKNWWCVVFPTLCTAATSDEAELRAAAGGFDEDEAAWITEEQPEYRLRFKTLEWLQKLKELFS